MFSFLAIADGCLGLSYSPFLALFTLRDLGVAEVAIIALGCFLGVNTVSACF